ncbi:hypothetical protein BSR28_08470 [Boudabousia liubingyangii]|uniref:ABC transporter permease n=1 Tax=Boudabousia liubingyangii TaxID=1921764 RepID=UPI00093F0C6E|nr:ABC transporter permease [Boudabousia liubingyangii]OKL46084.1 hypothetical protein BSR28_08470 [Boudabousia liubingyangii]
MKKQTQMSRWQEISLVSGRELKVTLFKKATIISTLLMMVLAIGGVLAMHFIGTGNSKLVVGIDDPAKIPAISQIKSLDEDQDPVEVVTMDRAAAEKDLKDGDSLDVYVDTSKTPIEVLGWRSVPSGFISQLSTLSAQQALDKEIKDLGGDPQGVAQKLAEAQPKAVILKNLEEPNSGGTAATFGISFVVLILLFILILSGGQMVAMSVVEEKVSRIVEILLATVRPSSLLTGKILGTGLASILSTGAVILSGVITAAIVGDLSSMQFNFGMTLAISLIWLVVGFLTFAVLYAAVGATVSRQEDLGQAIMPLLFLIMIPYFVGVSVLPANPESTMIRWMSYVPFFGPFLAPARYALGVATTMDTVLSLAIGILFCPLAIWVSARIYKGAILRTGARVKLKDAWKNN